MAFHYSDLAEKKISEAYERLLLDCMTGDSTLYARADAVKASWNLWIQFYKHGKTIPIFRCISTNRALGVPNESNALFDDKYVKCDNLLKNLKRNKN